MEFPELTDEEQMNALIYIGKGLRIHPIYTDGQKVVPDMTQATKIAFFEKGSVTAKYQLRGDGAWKRISPPA